MKKQLFALFLPLFLCYQADALFELRAGYGIQTPAETDYTVGTLSTMAGYNLDAIFQLPTIPLGFGLRYEDMGFEYKQSGLEYTSEMKRTSILINYRLIDLFAYFGFIGTLGVANSAKIANSIAGTAEYDADFTYSVGIEGGVSLGLIMIGAELGYLNANFESTTTNPDLDLSGLYLKALVGVGF